MLAKHWLARAVKCLEESLGATPHELNELDWKVDLTDNKDRLAEHLMAFANHSGGGTLVYGVDNATCRPIGVSADTVSRVTNDLANLGRQAVEPALALDHSVIDHHGVQLLLVHIPEQMVKPVHRRGKGSEETWVRSAGTTRKASKQEVGGLMLNSETPRWENLRASPLLDLDEVWTALDLETIANLLQRPLPTGDDRLPWLIEQSMVVPDGRGMYITNFGAIAAAKHLENFPTLERKRIRVIRYEGTNKVNTLDETLGHRGYAIGFEGLISHLKRILPHSEVIKQSLRTEVTLYPEIALRELIANALIHQDFMLTGTGPMVEIYDDRIEVTNPGTLLPGKKPDRLIGATPQSRNERLASSFRLYRICEERGTGFQKIVQSIELFGMPPLSVRPQDDSFKVILSAPRKFGDMSTQERIEAAYQHAVLQYLSSQVLTNTSLRERFKLHEKQRQQVTNVIGEAVAAGRIKRKDAGSGKKFSEYLPYWA